MGYIAKTKIGSTTYPVGSCLYGTCATAAATTEKDVVCSDFDTLLEGVTIHVKFTHHNGVANPTLDVNSTGAKAIKRYGTTAPSTSAGSSWQDGSVVSFTYDGTYWQMNGWLNDNSNTYDREYLNATTKAVSAITAGTLMCGTASGYKQVAKGVAFDISYPICYTGSAYAANGTRSDPYPAIPFSFKATNGGTAPNFTAYKAVYLKGKLVGSTFTIDSTTMWTQTVPTSADGFQYYLLGTAYTTESMRLIHVHPIFEYRDGSFHKHNPTKATYTASTETLEINF